MHTMMRKRQYFQSTRVKFRQSFFINRNVLSYMLYKYMPKCCNTACQQDDERMPPFRNLSGMPIFKTIKRTCMFDKVIVLAIKQIATNIWK